MDTARADIAVRIEVARQEMNVDVDGVRFATWAVSTARRGYRTPIGAHTPYLLDRMHYSKLYDYTAMPHSIFFLEAMRSMERQKYEILAVPCPTAACA